MVVNELDFQAYEYIETNFGKPELKMIILEYS